MTTYGGDLFKSGHSWRLIGVIFRCKWCMVTHAAVRDGRKSEECKT